MTTYDGITRGELIDEYVSLYLRADGVWGRESRLDADLAVRFDVLAAFRSLYWLLAPSGHAAERKQLASVLAMASQWSPDARTLLESVQAFERRAGRESWRRAGAGEWRQLVNGMRRDLKRIEYVLRKRGVALQEEADRMLEERLRCDRRRAEIAAILGRDVLLEIDPYTYFR